MPRYRYRVKFERAFCYAHQCELEAEIEHSGDPEADPGIDVKACPQCIADAEAAVRAETATGNEAKLREAVERLLDRLKMVSRGVAEMTEVFQIANEVKAALAQPPACQHGCVDGMIIINHDLGVDCATEYKPCPDHGKEKP